MRGGAAPVMLWGVRLRSIVLLPVLLLPLVGACGGSDGPGVEAKGSTTAAGAGPTTSSTAAAGLAQPALWPAAGVVLDSPEAAARDFVEKVLEVPPVISEFRAGDGRSGEIDVYSPGEGGTRRIVRGTLLLRRLGPDDGWFIIGAVNDNATISRPSTGDEVRRGKVEVAGRARGFEATVVVSAFIAGHADQRLDQEVTQGGAYEGPEPYTAALDLSGAQPGATVVLLVRGGTGLETDPGEFGAIPVVVSSR